MVRVKTATKMKWRVRLHEAECQCADGGKDISSHDDTVEAEYSSHVEGRTR